MSKAEAILGVNSAMTSGPKALVSDNCGRQSNHFSVNFPNTNDYVLLKLLTLSNAQSHVLGQQGILSKLRKQNESAKEIEKRR